MIKKLESLVRERLEELGHDVGELCLYRHKYGAVFEFGYYECKKCGLMFSESSIDSRIIMVFKNIYKGCRTEYRTYVSNNFLPPPNCDELIIKDIIE